MTGSELGTDTRSISQKKWRRYPRYKDSGVEWLREIPEGWEIKKIKHTTYVKGRIGWQGLRSDEFIDDGPFLVTGTDFNDGSINWATCYHVSEKRYEEDPYIQLQENDLLLTKDGSIGKTAIVKNLPGKATLNSGLFLTRLKNKAYSTKFMYYLFNSNVFSSFIEFKKMGTTISHLYQNVFVEFSYPLPRSLEQNAIITFLDRETARIDALIAKKERQIEILQEKRAALISHAVTKGLDPSVPMKDSGIEWLGSIPCHWEIILLKYLSCVQTGIAKGKDLTGKEVIEIPYLRVANVQDGFLDLSDITTIEIEPHEIHRYSLKKGDILMNEGGDEDKLGRGTIWNEEITPCIHQNHVFAVRPFDLSNSMWIDLITLSDYAKFYFLVNAKKTTNLASISATNISQLPVIFPPKEERFQILNYIQEQERGLQIAMRKIKSSIEKLTEYRSSLISAAVTGKIDVRQEVTI
ncbi:MAG: Type-1 restriction enzyme MjaXIP specificity protein [Methanoregulaceae archaeon PtaU1.Bin066]|nr:MAG: Type-1 restriction enzyme MjaXIP specificity protein [Methanoregulaceae archaeon PtaU1.Bin066]